MDIGSVLLILALAVLVGVFIAQPLLEHRSRAVTEAEQQRSALLAERDRILTALEELEFDYQLGKIPEEDYPLQRAALLKRGADVLRQLDALEGDTPTGQTDTERLAAALEARRAQKQAMLDPDDEVEALLAARRARKREKAAGFCGQCGAPLHTGDRFCPRCGTPVA